MELNIHKVRSLAMRERTMSVSEREWKFRLRGYGYGVRDTDEGRVITLTGQQLNWLLDGYDVMRLTPHERLHFSSVL